MNHIYDYYPSINLLDNDFLNLDDNTMYNDNLIVYANLHNRINFKVRNRDRVTQIPNQVIFNVIRHDNKQLLLQLYLDVNIEGKYFYSYLSPEHLKDLDPNTKYEYFCIKMDENNVTQPLYTTHNYHINGELVVKNTHNEPSTKIIDFNDNLITNNYLVIDDTIISIDYFDNNSVLDTTNIIIEKYKDRYLQAEVDNDLHWKEYMIINVDDFKTNFSLPVGKYRVKTSGESKYNKKIVLTFID